MQLTKTDKISTTVVCTMVILAITLNFNSLKSIFIKNKPTSNVLNSNPLYIYKEKLPAKIKQTSQKYKFLEEIYTSDKPVLFFSYDPLSIAEKENRILYKNITDKLEQNPQLKQNIKIYKNGHKKIKALKSKYSSERKSCSLTSSGNMDLDDLIELTDNCFESACIIVPNKNQYYELSRDADYMLKQLSNIIVK